MEHKTIAPVKPPDPLSRRVTEIVLAKKFFDAIEQKWDRSAALEILRQVVRSDAESAAAAVPGRPESRTFADLYEVWKVLGGENRLALELDELSGEALRFHVNACAYAEEYEKRGLTGIGVEFSCRRDKPFAEALLPGVRLTQSRTIMEGGTRCEFEYRLGGKKQ
ncbi:MAG: L-2-amino-thiazoline-4-carboxylic acid hydrolase [Treponema sp.]|jgi:hypothetical protein|nr:L-2-amino-thiazoline-4-carboxylic acid hydrolase [Treponema sp.]